MAVLSALSFGFALVALLLRYFNDVSTQKTEELNETWEPAMLEVLAGSASPQALAALVDERDTDDFLGFLLGYARRLRGEEREKVRAIAEPYLPDLERRVENRSAEARGLAVQALAEMGMPRYAGVVAKALDDESPVVAMIAARGLFRPGQERYFSNVLRRLHRFTLWSRSYLASMLAGGGPATAPLLREMLADPEQPPLVRAVTTDALSILNDLGTVDVALRLIEEVDDRELLAGCLRLIRELGHREHVDRVMRFVTDSDPVIRAAAVAAIGSLGGKDDVPILQSLLDDESYWVSLQAARGLMALGELAILRRLAAGEGPWALLARQVLSE
ncbi:MAG: HEAT repeat domain-containing protein [Gemmatimonadota bacterium]